ncbi:MAG: carbon-nitrogen hydrolase [Verrucomicrobiae bacterium]|nr:carbon-nitrogen hydrolase [Verrucomicrobiae bacterium]
MKPRKALNASRSVPLALLQHACTPDPRENLATALEAADRAARDGARILCTQELFASEYFCQTEDHAWFDLAEPIPGPSTRAFQKLARQREVVVVASLFEKRAPGLYHNTAVVIDADGTLLGLYRKMHIPDDPLFYEKFYFTPGDLGFRAWRTHHGVVGVLICWDQWYPEAARLTALHGAEVLLYPTAIGWHPSEKAAHGAHQHQAWETIQRAHAIANGCYVAAVNRIGLERPAGGDGIEFWGQSFVAGTQGEILARAAVARPETLIVPLEFGKLDVTRTHWPFLRDRRVDAYDGLTQRYLGSPTPDTAPARRGRQPVPGSRG